MIPQAILQLFCDTESGLSYDLTKPHRVGQLTYATDGRIAIRVEGDYEAETEGRYPDVQAVIDQFKGRGKWLPLPPSPPKGDTGCGECE